MGARVVLLSVLAAGCESAPSPAAFAITAVEPSTWTIGRFDDSVTIHGTDFFLSVRPHLAGELALDDGFRGTLGDAPLPSVTWGSNRELSATPPAELPEGLHDLTITTRDGRSATLHDAVRVVPFTGELLSWSDMGDSVPVDETVDTSASGDGISNSPESAAQPALLLEDNYPMVAWSESAGGDSYIFVSRHDGDGWQELGGSLTGTGVSGPGQASWPALAMRPDGDTLLAYQRRGAAAWRIHLHRYDGNWQPYAPTPSGTAVTDVAGERPALVWDVIDQRPVVAWQASDGIHAATFDGAWVGLGGGSTLVGGSNGGENPSLAGNASGLYLAFDAPGSSSRQIKVARWNSTVWSGVNGSMDLTGVGATPGDSTRPSMVVQDSGDVVVVWQDDSLSSGTEIFARRSNGGAWQAVADSMPPSYSDATGGISKTPGESLAPSLAVTGDVLMVVWQQGHRVLARQLDETYENKWIAPQGALEGVVFLGSGPVAAPRVASSAHGRPTVVWAHGPTDASQIYLARRSCQLIWEELVVGATGAVSQTRACAEAPSLALYADLRPVVAWHQSNDPYTQSDSWHIYLRHFDGDGWSGRTGSGTGEGISNMSGHGAGFPSLVVDDDDEPWVAYSQWYDAWRWEVLVRHPYLADWVGLDGSGADPGLSDHSQPSLYSSLAIDPAGGLQVTWQQFIGTGQHDLAVSYHQPGSWSSLGNPSSATFPWFPSLAVDSTGDPIMAWHEIDGPSWSVHVKRWQSNSWFAMGGGSSRVDAGTGRAGPAVLALTDADEPLVAWQDTSAGQREIHFAAWSTIGGWQQLGGSWNVSQTTGQSVEPSLVIDHEQAPIIAWADDTTGNWEIFVHRYNGGGWAAIDGALNVSNTRGTSRQPSLAFRDRRLCVAWTESGFYGAEIAVRCIDL